MKVLLVSPGIWAIPAPKGAENHLYHLANELANLGCEVHLVSDVDEAAPFREDVSIHQVRLPSLPLFKYAFWGYLFREIMGGIFAFRKARQVLKRNNCDVINTHGKLASLLLALLNKKLPLVLTVHDDPPLKGMPHYWVYRIAYKSLTESAAKRADRTLVWTVEQKKDLVSRDIAERKVALITDGVDTKIFGPGSDGRGDYCLFVGTLAKRKGIEYLLRAMARLDNLSCVIVGDGPERGFFVHLAKDLRIAERAHFLGAIVDPHKLADIYRGCSFFVLPSLYEQFGIVILEAMACGKPVITTAHPGPCLMVKDGYNGFVVEPGDVEGLARKMSLLNESPDLRREMGQRALLTVREGFSWESVAHRIFEVYEEATRGKQG